MTLDNPRHGNDDTVRHDKDIPFFVARLTPHRSLSPRGFAILMIGVGTISFVAGLVFWINGAWPVMGFFGLDVAIVYVAFRLSFRQARASEEIEVSCTDLRVTRRGPSGASQVYHFNPAWVRLDIRRVEEEGIVALALVSHGRSEPVGGFLNPADRATFADALGRAIAAARRGEPVEVAGPGQV